ncbi:MAG: FG-GAP-like repeat-containing protein [Phycisphaerales bacterium]
MPCALRRAAIAALTATSFVRADDRPSPFTEEAAQRGLVYSYGVSGGSAGWGLCFADLDDDGDADLVAIGGTGGTIGLWENDGAGHFTSRAAGSGLPSLNSPSSVLAFDADGDGDLDLWVGHWNVTSRLFRNNGNFHFVEVTAPSGLGNGSNSCAGSAACDVDGDGDVDLYVARYGLPNRLFLNDGGGGFTQFAQGAGVADAWNSWQVVALDYDDDGDPDFYVSEDKKVPTETVMHNRLYQNDGAGMFVETSRGSGADVNAYSMGVAIGDVDGNGFDDIYCANLVVEPAPLLLNQGDGTFVESSIRWGVENLRTAWGTAFFDYDNDGLLDLYVCNFLWPNRLYHNVGAPPMVDVAPELNATLSGFSHCMAIADIDGDGDVDIAVQEDGQPLRLLVNNEGGKRHCVMLDVVGTPKNRAAIGARASLRVGDSWRRQSVLCGGNGFKGQNAFRLHFGIGDASTADEVIVRWRDGATRTLTNVPAGTPWRVYRTEALGDADGDGDRDLLDFASMVECLASGFGPGCERFDANGDSAIDALDVAAFLPSWSSPVPDCDGDGVPDPLQIAADPTLDRDRDGLLDACGLASADLTCDGVVDARDLAVLLGEWQRPTSPADLDHDGVVDAADVARLVASWTSGA